MEKKVLVLSTPDLDATAGSWLYLRAHKLGIKDVGWKVVRSGLRADQAEFPGQELIHIDTGGKFDGVREFDHHHNDQAVVGECAASLVYMSFLKAFGDDPILKDLIKFVRAADNGRGDEGVMFLCGQYAPVIRAISPLLLALRPIRPATEVIFSGIDCLDAYYEGTKRVRDLMNEISRGGKLHLIGTQMGQVLFGETERSRKEIRNFVLKNMEPRPALIVCSYGDNSVGVTVLNPELKIRLQDVERLVLKENPECVGRTFVHGNGFVLYVHPLDNNKKSVPKPDELLDTVKYAFKKFFS